MDAHSKLNPYCEVDEDIFPLPEPVFGMPCKDSCHDGTYATVDAKNRRFECKKCPANTYSVGGGGIRIDGAMGAFGYHGEDGNVMPLAFEASCQVHGNQNDEFYKNEDCSPWSRTGTSLKAFESPVNGAVVDYDLTYPVFFDDEGTVSFKFRKDSYGTPGVINGVFKFMIDGVVQF